MPSCIVNVQERYFEGSHSAIIEVVIMLIIIMF